jgi:ubiquinone/menaquinone biosynthesis C-methylase UbiE
MGESGVYWRSAEVSALYERLTTSLLAQAGRDLVAMAEPPIGGRVLDLGSGTGVCAEAAREYTGARGLVVAADRSVEMLEAGLDSGRSLTPVAADAADLPFADGAFDVVTAAFVVGWLADAHRSLAEMMRVVRAGGKIAISWHDGTPTHDDADASAWDVWWEQLTALTGEPMLEDLWNRVLPSAASFSDASAMHRTLVGSGLDRVRVVSRDYRAAYSIEGFIEMAANAPDARFAHEEFGPTEWARVLSRAKEAFAGHGEPLYDTEASLLAVGVRR